MNRFRHQQEEYRVHRYALARALAWQMRTGKTRAVVESARALHEAMEIEGVLVIAPNGVHRQWAEEQIKKWGGTENNTFTWASTHPNNDKNFMLFTLFTGVRSRLHWFCINMEALILPRAQKAIKTFKKLVGPAMLVVDECFVAGTIIDGIPIEQRKPGQVISSWNESENRIVLSGIKATFSRVAPRYLYELQIGNEVIVTTANHPFLTTRGWVDAKNLIVGEILYENKNKNVSMLNVWTSMSQEQQKRERQGTSLSSMLSFNSNGEAKRDGRSGTNENEQSHEEARNSRARKSDAKIHELQTTRSWWERLSTAGTRISLSKGTWIKFIKIIRGCNSHLKKARQRLSNVLQGRFGIPICSTSDRGGRYKPWIISSSRTGPKENESVSFIRLDSIKVLEQGRDKRFNEVCPNNTVYNLETETGTYCARSIVVHNSHHFARAGAKRTSIVRGLGRVFEYRRLLSGTLAENSPLQTFSQYEILDRAALGHPVLNSSDKSDCPTCKSGCMGFKNDFCEFGMERQGDRLVTTITGFKNLDKLKQRMAKYTSVVLRSDCEDLPPLQFDHRIVEMTKKQEEWWHTVRDQSLEDIYRLGQERVFDGGAALVKLQQIEGGYWKKKDHIEELVRPEQNPKMLILLDEIMQYDGQVIAWFAFIHEIDAALKFLQSRKIRCGVFHGRARERDRDLAAFRSGDRQVLLAQPQAGGEGRDMSAAGKIVWFSHTPDAVVRNQANERATKMGARQIQIVDMIAPIGKYFLKLTAKKTTLADDVSRYGLRAVLESIERR